MSGKPDEDMEGKVQTAGDKKEILLKLKAVFDEQFDRQLAALELKDNVTEWGCTEEDTPVEEALGRMFGAACREVHDGQSSGEGKRVMEQFFDTLKWAYVQDVKGHSVDMWVHGSWDQAYLMSALVVKLTQLGLCQARDSNEKDRYLVPVYSSEELTAEENGWLNRAIFYNFMESPATNDICLGHRYDAGGGVLEYWNLRKTDRNYFGIWHNFKHTELPKEKMKGLVFNRKTRDFEEYEDYRWDGEKLLKEIESRDVNEVMRIAGEYIAACDIPLDGGRPEDILRDRYTAITIYPFEMPDMPERFRKDLRGSRCKVHEIFEARKHAVRLAGMSDLDEKYYRMLGHEPKTGDDYRMIDRFYQEDHDREWDALSKIMHDCYRGWWT